MSVHYKGMFLDGGVFDDSYKRGNPIEFPVGMGNVIPGWDEGILLLNKGDKARFVIPSQLAYGEAGASTSFTIGQLRWYYKTSFITFV